MDTNKRNHSGEGRTNPDVAFDATDLSARGIILFFVALAVFAVVVHLVVYGMYKGYSAIAAKADPEQSPLVKPEPPPQASVLQNTSSVRLEKFGGVPLQADDAYDMQIFLEEEEAQLHAGPWRDAKGNVHLPIEAAMLKLLDSGRVAVRPGAVAAPQTYPGAGREFSGIAALQQMETAPEAGPNLEGMTSPAKAPEEKRTDAGPEKIVVPK